MPYSGASDTSLPPAVRKMPKAMREMWVKVFNENYDPEDESRAFKMAHAAVRKVKTAKEARSMAYADMDDVKVWLLGTKAMKTDNGMAFGMGAFLFHPDEAKPSTWKIRIEEAPGKVTVAQLGRAAAALSGKGFMGNPTQGIAGERAAMAKRLIGLYRSHKVADADIPDYLWGIGQMHKPGTKEGAFSAGFKTVQQADGRTRWLMLSTGAFEDRDGEIMSQAFIESALEFAEKQGDRGTLNVWHVRNSDIGTCDFQALVGNPGFLLESGLFDDTPAGRKAAKYYSDHASEYGGSIEFASNGKTAEGVYEAPGVITRRSLLPSDKAAFPWSAVAVKEYTMAKNRQDAVAEFARLLDVDEAKADAVLQHLEADAGALRDYGIRWKETDEVTEPETVESAVTPDTPTSEVAVVQAEAVTEPVVEAAVVEPEKVAEALEVVITPETMTGIVNQTIAALQPVISALEEKLASVLAAVSALGEQHLTVATATKELQTAVTELKTTDDAKIADKVRNLPRATVKSLTQPAQRPTQRTPDSDADESMLDKAHKTLYG